MCHLQLSRVQGDRWALTKLGRFLREEPQVHEGRLRQEGHGLVGKDAQEDAVRSGPEGTEEAYGHHRRIILLKPAVSYWKSAIVFDIMQHDLNTS